MKIVLALLAAVAGVSAAAQDISSGIAADSEMGMKLLSQARRLDDNADASYTWVTGYSLKFQGCHHISQWNAAVDEDNDVRIETKRLALFRLCPSSSCSDQKAAGCTKGYGDYVVDLNTFVSSYYEAKTRADEYACTAYLEGTCASCADDADTQETCEWNCLQKAGMTYCADKDPYDENAVEKFDIEGYVACGEYKVNGNKYYLGPYCANQGGSVYMGLFTDDTCTEYADDAAGVTTFTELSGVALPYSDTSLIGMGCISCAEEADANEQHENDQADGDSVSQECEAIYNTAGKCESALPSGMTTPNNNACNYISGIKIVRKDGIIETSSTRPSPAATAFICIFAMSFAGLAFYAWYLRTRLGVKNNALL